MNKVTSKKVYSSFDGNNKVLAITGVNVVNPLQRKIYENQTIVCSNGKIISIGSFGLIPIPNNAKILNLSGQYIIPGLIDTHVHLAHPGVDDYGRISFESMKSKYKRHFYLTLKSGVTTVRNMPGSFGYGIMKIRDKVNKGEILGPRIFASGPALTVPYGYFSVKRFIPAPPMLLKILSLIFGAHGLSIDINNIHDVSEVIKKLKHTGVDFIKTITPGTELSIANDDPQSREYYIKRKVNPKLLDSSMKPEILQEIVKHAHKEGLKVSAHSICLPDGFKQAIQAGIDSIEHTPFGLLDDETFTLMNEKNIYWIPTAFAFKNCADLINNPELFNNEEIKKAIPEPYYSIGKKALQEKQRTINSGEDPIWSGFYAEMSNYKQSYFPVNLAKAMKKGVKIVAGTDAGMGGAGYVPHGFLYKELEMFANNGMDEFEAIKTATINAAELLGMDKEIGSIELGKIADLVIIRANPIENISNINQIEYVIKSGEIVYCENDKDLQ